MEQIVNLIEVLIWPVIFVVLVWWKRKQIGGIFSSIKTFKFRDIEINFSEKIDQMKKNVEDSQTVEVTPIIEKNKLYESIEISPASSVIEIWNTLERSASNKVSNLLPVDESFKDPLNRPFEYLDYKDALPYNISSILRDLRNLRNQAAHLGTREISRQDVLQYAEVAARVWRHIEIIEDLPKVKLTAFTVLILQINSLIDSKNFDDISIDEVHDWIEKQEGYPRSF